MKPLLQLLQKFSPFSSPNNKTQQANTVDHLKGFEPKREPLFKKSFEGTGGTGGSRADASDISAHGDMFIIRK